MDLFKYFLRNTFNNRKSVIILAFVLLILIISITVLLIVKPWENENESRTVLGEAEAVMTTKIGIFDGIWESTRYSDEFYNPIGIALINGDIIVADYYCDRIQIIDDEKNKRIGRPGLYGLSYRDSGALADGFRENAMFRKPSGIFVCPEGTVIIADTGNHAVRRMDDEFVITVAGNGTAGYQNGKEGEAFFNSPRSAVMCSQGYIYVADTMNHCIRRIDGQGNVTLFAGIPQQSGYANGNLTDAMFNEPFGMVIDIYDVLYIADSANHAIRKIENGIVTTVAGRPGETDRFTGYSQGGYTDGNNDEALFNFPRGIALMPDGSIIVADSMNHVIRMITTNNTHTLIGNGTAEQFYASAENLKMARPEGVYTDGKTLFISDSFNNRVLTVPLTERILEGRPSRDLMLARTGVSTASRYSYQGDIRVFIGDEWVDMGRVAPWNTPDAVYVPIRPLFEALGAIVTLNERTNTLTIAVADEEAVLNLDRDYFILRGVAVTTTDEIMRLFPYTFEWFPEFSLIALNIPSDLRI